MTNEGEVRDQTDEWSRFAAVKYDASSGQFVFSARRWNSTTSSYICQTQGLPYIANYGVSRSLVLPSHFLSRCIVSNAVLAMSEISDCLSVRPSVCSFVKRVNSDKTRESSAHILILYKRSMHLVFRHEEWLAGNVPFYLNFRPN